MPANHVLAAKLMGVGFYVGGIPRFRLTINRSGNVRVLIGSDQRYHASERASCCGADPASSERVEKGSLRTGVRNQYLLMFRPAIVKQGADGGFVNSLKGGRSLGHGQIRKRVGMPIKCHQ